MTESQAEQLADFYAAEAELVAAMCAAGWSQTTTLRLIGLAASSWHYRRNPRPGTGVVVAHTARRAQAWLSDEETAAIIDTLKTAFKANTSVHQAYFEALDAGNPVASLKSWYRLAQSYLDAERPARRTRRHRCTAMPHWEATAAMQVWSWDITMLPGPYVGISYCLYAVLDVFSRKVVAWRVEHAEVDELAAQMFTEVLAGLEPQQRPRLLHSDRGVGMST